MNARKRTVLYGRTSRNKSEGRSVDDQLAKLRAWAERSDREVVAVLRDDGVSASRYAGSKVRNDWQRAVELISTRQTDELAVWESSRMTRRRMEWAALVDVCTESGVDVAVDGRVYDPTDPDDMHSLDIDMAGNIRESAKISKRTLRGVESRAPVGRPHGSLNYGYRIEYDLSNGKPLRRVPDPEQAAVVLEIAERLLAGESASTIARDLNKRAIPNPRGGAWIGGNMTAMIQSPAYAGLRVHRGEVLDVAGTWPALLDRPTHDRLVALLSDPARRSIRTGEHVRHLLVGVASCAVCGGRIRTLTRRRSSGVRLVRYGCAVRFCVSRLAEPVDLYVEGAVVKFLSRPDVLAELADTDDDGAATARARAAELRAELARARTMHRDGRLSLDSLAAMEAWALPEVAACERRARPRALPAVVTELAGPDAGARWAGTPIGARREVVRVLFDVAIGRTTRGANQYTPFDAGSISISRRRR